MHMAQLRHDYDKFVAQEAEILVVGPENQEAFQDYWAKNSLPFTGLPDPDHSVANLYGQQVKLLKLGRLPALMVIDKDGHIRYARYGNSMQDIPRNNDILDLLTKFNAG
jgi:peroxiredoxin Q/BCP